MRRSKAFGYAVFVAVTVTAALSAAAVFFEITGHAGHSRVLPAGLAGTLPLLVDAAGVVATVLLLLQLSSGFGLMDFDYQAFRRFHLAIALSIMAVVLAHGTGAVVHTVEAPEVLPVWLDAMGGGIVAVLLVMLLSGFAVSRYRKKRTLPLHVWLGVALLAATVAHDGLAIYHTLTG